MSCFRNLIRFNAKDWSHEAATQVSGSLKIAKYTGVTPYDWNAEKEELEFSQSPTRFAIFVSQFLLILTYQVFVICRWIAFNLDQNSTTQDKGVLQYVAIAYSVPILAQLSSIQNLYNLYTYMNRLLHFMRHDFKRLPHDGNKVHAIGKWMTILPCAALATLTLNVSTVFRRPESPQLLTSLLPDVARRNKWELIPFALLHGYIWCNQWGVVLFYCSVILSYISATRNALNRTRPNPHLSPEGFCRATRQLELLQGNANALLRTLLYGIELVVVPVTVYAFCGSIRSEGAQAAKLLIVAVLVLTVLLKVWSGLGGIFETSSEILAEWKKREEMPSSLFRKQFKSMRPIRAQIGHYYVDAACRPCRRGDVPLLNLITSPARIVPTVPVIVLNMSTVFRRPESPQLLSSLLPDVATRNGRSHTPSKLLTFFEVNSRSSSYPAC